MGPPKVGDEITQMLGSDVVTFADKTSTVDCRIVRYAAKPAINLSELEGATPPGVWRAKLEIFVMEFIALFCGGNLLFSLLTAFANSAEAAGRSVPLDLSLINIAVGLVAALETRRLRATRRALEFDQWLGLEEISDRRPNHQISP